MTPTLSRILALVLGQGAVLLVLCWSSLFRSYTAVAGYWSVLLIAGLALYFFIVTRLHKGEPWN